MRYIKIKIALFILVLIPILSIIFIWIKECKNPFIIDYNIDQWAVILSTFLGYIGTGSLGLLALWQSEKANDIAEKSLYNELEMTKNELRKTELELASMKNESIISIELTGEIYNYSYFGKLSNIGNVIAEECIDLNDCSDAEGKNCFHFKVKTKKLIKNIKIYYEKHLIANRDVTIIADAQKTFRINLTNCEIKSIILNMHLKGEYEFATVYEIKLKDYKNELAEIKLLS